MFEKPLKPFKVMAITDGICVCEADDGVHFNLYVGNEVVVQHRINISGSDFLVDKRAQKAFIAGLRSVGFTEKVTQ